VVGPRHSARVCAGRTSSPEPVADNVLVAQVRSSHLKWTALLYISGGERAVSKRPQAPSPDEPAVPAHQHERAEQPNARERITISCTGCGRTQSLRLSKLVRCDGYWCGLGYCVVHPEVTHPPAPAGSICELMPYAAGSFSGHTIRPITDSERMAVKRAQRLRDRGHGAS
jgi:hypothetical protein